MPPTTSWVPSFRAAPWRTAWPMRTSPEVSDVHRRAALRLQHDLPDVVLRTDQADAADDVLLGLLRHDAAADVRVVRADPLVHLLERQVVLEQPVRVDDHLVLLQVPAERVDLGHAGHALEERRHHPVLQRAQAGEVVHRVAAGHAGFRLERVLVDLAHRRGHRPERGLHAFRHLPAGLGQPFEDELPREVDVHVVVEDQRDDGDPVLGDRAHRREARQAAHRALDGVGDELLDLERRQARSRADHLDLDVGDVREGVDRNRADRPRAQGDGHDDEEHDGQAVAQRPGHQSFDHVFSLGAAGPRATRPPATTSGTPP